MAKDPAMLFYTSDFLTGTLFMTNEQVGIYVRLLCAQHQHGGMIDKTSFNSIVGNHNIIRGKFVEVDDGFFNERLMIEMDKRKVKSSNLSANATVRWKKAKQKDNKCNAIASDLNMPTEDANENVNEDRNKNEVKKKISKKLTDEEWLKSIKDNPAYQHIEIDRELAKMDAWLSTQPGRKKTRRFIINWLNKVEKPVSLKPVVNKNEPPRPDILDMPDITEKQRQKNINGVKNIVKKLADRRGF